MYSTQPCNTIQTSPTSLQVIYHVPFCLVEQKQKKTRGDTTRSLKAPVFKILPFRSFQTSPHQFEWPGKKHHQNALKAKKLASELKKKQQQAITYTIIHIHRSHHSKCIKCINLTKFIMLPFCFGHLTFLPVEILAFQDSRPIATEGTIRFCWAHSMSALAPASSSCFFASSRNDCWFFSAGFPLLGCDSGGFNLCQFLLGCCWILLDVSLSFRYHDDLDICDKSGQRFDEWIIDPNNLQLYRKMNENETRTILSKKPCHSHVAAEERTHVLWTASSGGLGGFNQTSARTSDGNARFRGRYPQLGALNKWCTSLKLEDAKCGLLRSNIVNQYILHAYTYIGFLCQKNL